MPRDVDTLKRWLLVVVIIAGVGINAIPISYSIAPWWKHSLGRLFMWMSLSFALLVDMAVLLQFWRPKDILTIFWMEALVWTTIGASNIGMAIFIIWSNILRRKHRESD